MFLLFIPFRRNAGRAKLFLAQGTVVFIVYFLQEECWWSQDILTLGTVVFIVYSLQEECWWSQDIFSTGNRFFFYCDEIISCETNSYLTQTIIINSFASFSHPEWWQLLLFYYYYYYYYYYLLDMYFYGCNDSFKYSELLL